MYQACKRIITRYTALVIFLASFVMLAMYQYKLGVSHYLVRFVHFVQNMLIHGPSLFPITHGQPYPDYPVTNTYLLYLSSLAFGKLSVLSMGVPYCAAGALCLVLIYQIGALQDKRWGHLCRFIYIIYLEIC